MKVVLRRMGHTLVPADDDNAELLQRLPAGRELKADISAMRNPVFHRKAMKLFHVAHDLWDEQAHRRRSLDPSIPRMAFDVFRKNVTIRAGFFEQVFHFDGSFHLEALSIAWDKMEDAQFSEVVSAVIDVLVGEVLEGCTESQLLDIVRFA